MDKMSLIVISKFDSLKEYNSRQLIEAKNHSEEGTSTTSDPNEPHSDDIISTSWMSTIPLLALTFITFLANGAILSIFIRSRTIRKCRNVYILSLALADFIVGFTTPLAVMESLHGHWTFTEQTCAVYLIIRNSLLLISVSSIVLLTIDRWWCVNFPISYRVRQSRRTAAILVVMIWLVAFPIHIPIIFTSNPTDEKVAEFQRKYCAFREPYHSELTVINSSITCFIPVLLLVFLNIGINVTLFKRRNTKTLRRCMSTNDSNSMFSRKYSVDSNQSTGSLTEKNGILHKVGSNRNSYFFIFPRRQSTNLEVCRESMEQYKRGSIGGSRKLSVAYSEDESKCTTKQKCLSRKQSDDVVREYLVRQDKKAILSLGLLALVAIICHTPFYVISVVYSACSDCVPLWLLVLSYWICISTSAINPFLYGFGNSDLRKTLKSCITCNYSQNIKLTRPMTYFQMASNDLESVSSEGVVKKQSIQLL